MQLVRWIVGAGAASREDGLGRVARIGGAWRGFDRDENQFVDAADRARTWSSAGAAMATSEEEYPPEGFDPRARAPYITITLEQADVVRPLLAYDRAPFLLGRQLWLGSADVLELCHGLARGGPRGAHVLAAIWEAVGGLPAPPAAPRTPAPVKERPPAKDPPAARAPAPPRRALLRDQLLEYLDAHPQAVNGDLSEHFGISVTDVLRVMHGGQLAHGLDCPCVDCALERKESRPAPRPERPRTDLAIGLTGWRSRDPQP